MRENDEASVEGDGLFLAVLSGDPEADAPVREAMERLESPWRAVEDGAAVLAAAEEEPVAAVVMDASPDDADPAGVAASLADAIPGAPPPVLVVLPAGCSAADVYGEGTGIRHWLARPFQPETLVALCRALAGRPGAAGGEDGEPSVRVRGPARFSARPLYAEATRYVRVAFEAARDGGRPDLDGMRPLAEKIHTSLLQSNLLLLRGLEPYKRFELPQHCVNVAIIAAKISMGLDHPLSETHRIIRAGLLHDIGMTRLPQRILVKEGTLTDAEREEMQQHPVHGAAIVAELGDELGWLATVVRQEHERLQGQGYPEGLTGEEIHPMAKVIGVADVFEAFSQVRAYRSPFTLYEALEKVTSMRDDHFDRDVVAALASEISVFPLDSYVQLSTGEIGRVVASNTTNLMRPTVEVLWDRSWTPLDEPRRVELSRSTELSITRPLHEAEVPIT